MDTVKLTSSEWNVLNCLWEESPRTVMQIVAELERTVGWHRSTTITTLHRMESKELIRCVSAPSGRGTAYEPAVDRARAEVSETRSFLDRVYRGSVGMMMSAMAQRQELSDQDISELRAILDQAEKRKEEES